MGAVELDSELCHKLINEEQDCLLERS